MFTKGSVFDMYLIKRCVVGGNLTTDFPVEFVNDPAYEVTSKKNPLEGLSLDTTECINDENNDGVCAPEPVVNVLKRFVERVEGYFHQRKMSAKEYLKLAQKRTGCKDSEACVYEHPEFEKFVSETNIINPEYIRKKVLVQSFKPKGPRKSVAWLDNVNIDTTLAIWARNPKFSDFYPYSMNMVDFEGARYYQDFNRSPPAPEYKGSLALIDIFDILEGKVPVPQGPGFPDVYRPCRRMACVLNTDTSQGGGEHWVCLFIDCSSTKKPWSIEYFNSSGNFPMNPVIRFMYSTEKKLCEYQKKKKMEHVGVEVIESVAVSPHQKSNTECGMYCLFYIFKRLEGESYEYFQRNRIEDGWMVKFREYCFR
jgi:hypothetical protein